MQSRLFLNGARQEAGQIASNLWRGPAAFSSGIRAFSSGGPQTTAPPPVFCTLLSHSSEIAEMYQRFEVVQHMDALNRATQANYFKEMVMGKEMETVISTLKTQTAENPKEDSAAEINGLVKKTNRLI